MIINNSPYSARYIFSILMSWFRYFFTVSIRKKINHGGKLNFLYFSYQPDYIYLTLSIKSIIEHVDPKSLGIVFLIEDQKAPFSAQQKIELQTLCPSIKILPIHNFCWGSAQSTYEELQIFLKVSDLLENDWDLLVKTDSDVIVFEGHKFQEICSSNLKAIGDGHFLQFKYAQGGLYMLRKQLIKRAFSNTSVEDIEYINKQTNSVGEDKAISYLLKKQGVPFFLTRLMLFPDEYNNIKHLNTVKKEFVALHCHKDKEQMQNLANRFNIL